MDNSQNVAFFRVRNPRMGSLNSIEGIRRSWLQSTNLSACLLYNRGGLGHYRTASGEGLRRLALASNFPTFHVAGTCTREHWVSSFETEGQARDVLVNTGSHLKRRARPGIPTRLTCSGWNPSRLLPMSIGSMSHFVRNARYKRRASTEQSWKYCCASHSSELRRERPRSQGID
jgi:hypothetical protein